MENDGQTLEGGAEGAEDLTLEPANPDIINNGEGGSDDPLDDIKDEVARAEAKKARAIVRRNIKPKEENPEAKVKVPASEEFLKRSDFEQANERKAVIEATKDDDVKANWNEIRAFYTPRRGKATPEDILEDIKDAVTLYKSRNGAVEEKQNPASDLQTTTVTTGTAGGKTEKKETPKNPPGFRLPTKPSEWYGKKS